GVGREAGLRLGQGEQPGRGLGAGEGLGRGGERGLVLRGLGVDLRRLLLHREQPLGLGQRRERVIAAGRVFPARDDVGALEDLLRGGAHLLRDVVGERMGLLAVAAGVGLRLGGGGGGVHVGGVDARDLAAGAVGGGVLVVC